MSTEKQDSIDPDAENPPAAEVAAEQGKSSDNDEAAKPVESAPDEPKGSSDSRSTGTIESTGGSTPEGLQATKGLFRSHFDWLLLVGLLACVPLMCLQVVELWSHTFWRFFPLAWLVFVIFLLLRGSVVTAASGTRRLSGVVLAVGSFIALATAVILGSAWTSHLALVLLLTSWLLFRMGANPWTEVLSWSLLLAITLPLPADGDTVFISTIHESAQSSVSGLLDLTSIPHLPKGDEIELRQNTFKFSEGYRGYESVYALMALAMTVVVLYRHPFLVGLITVLSVVAWSWLGDVLMAYAISVAAEYGQYDWFGGWPYLACRLVTLLVMCLFVFLTQAGFARLLTPFPTKTITSNEVHTLYNGLVSWPGKNRFKKQRRSDEDSKLTKLESWAKPHSFKIAAYVLTLLMLIVGGVSVLPARQSGPWQPRVLPTLSQQSVDQLFAADSLPEELADMQLTAFSTEGEIKDTLRSEFQRVWTYSDSTRTASIILRFPVKGYQQVEQQYLEPGVELDGPIQEALVQTGASQERRIVSVSFVNEMQQFSLLFYMTLGPDGGSLTPEDAFRERGVLTSDPILSFQLELFVPNAERLSVDAQRELTGMLVAAAEALAPRIQQLTSGAIPDQPAAEGP